MAGGRDPYLTKEPSGRQAGWAVAGPAVSRPLLEMNRVTPYNIWNTVFALKSKISIRGLNGKAKIAD